MRFTNDNLDQIRAELNNVLRNYGISHTMDFKIGKFTYNDNSFKTTLEAFNTETGISGEQASFNQGRGKFGIPADWYGAIVELSGVEYEVVGINTRARKYPISLRNTTTGNIDKKCSADLIRGLLRTPNPMRNVTPAPLEITQVVV
jgi:hypothetical protein